MPGLPAVPALSEWTLPARWIVCCGVSRCLSCFISWLHVKRHRPKTSLILSPHYLFSRGFPQGGECQPCAPECASCRGNSSHCLSCEGHYFLLDRSCRSSCPKGFYTTDAECRHCPAHCTECNQDGLCNSKCTGGSRVNDRRFYNGTIEC